MAPPSEQDEHPVRRARPVEPGAHADAALEIVLNAGWVAPSLARDRVDAWLRSIQWPPAQIDELVLAVSEAVSNSVEHGYQVSLDAVEHPGLVELRIGLTVEPDGYRHVEFVVTDRGTWRTPDTAASTRGHGMLIMRSCTDELVVDGSAEGTTVLLRSRPVPPVP